MADARLDAHFAPVATSSASSCSSSYAPAVTSPAGTPQDRPRPPPGRARDKPQLSCGLCRRRKLKCDRQQPCSSCTSRGLGLSCGYAAASGPMQSQAAGIQRRSPLPSAGIQGRITQLEKLVVSLMQNSAAKDGADSAPGHGDVESPPPAEDDRSTSPTDHGSMTLSPSGSSYVSSVHWAAVLDGIAELKEHFTDTDDAVSNSYNSQNPQLNQTGLSSQLLYGCPRWATKEEIIAALPSRPVADRLISRYFNALDMAPGKQLHSTLTHSQKPLENMSLSEALVAIIHSGQFLAEYESFWRDPNAASVMWLGLLFTMICLATQFQRVSSDSDIHFQGLPMNEPDPRYLVNASREKIVQCLIFGQYTKPGPYVLETLLLYFTIEHFLCKDAEIGIWILLGIIVILAMRMGYHRDPQLFPAISPFEGEMRRRVWATILQLDLVISAQAGLPRMVKEWQTDTAAPRNLFDSDFDLFTQELPPSRAETEITPILYVLAKNRIMSVLGMISDLTTETRPYSYVDVMSVDKKLLDARLTIPSSLKWRPMAQSITDPPQTIMQRLYLEIAFHKAQIVLHRKYLVPSRIPGPYTYSSKVCLDASSRILEYQHIVEEETHSTGQLYHVRWKVSSLVNHDFLLATSILCSYLQQCNSTAEVGTERFELENIKQLLTKSYLIWHQSSAHSKEARKVSDALRIVLGIPLSTIGTPSSRTVLADVYLNNETEYNAFAFNQDYLVGLGSSFPFFDPMLEDPVMGSTSTSMPGYF